MRPASESTVSRPWVRLRTRIVARAEAVGPEEPSSPCRREIANVHRGDESKVKPPQKVVAAKLIIE